MNAWFIWLVIAIGLFLLELVTPQFFSSCMGIGALLGSLFSVFSPFWVQSLVFFLASVLAIAFLRPVLQKGDKRLSGVDAMIGKEATVLSEVSSNGGRIRIGSESWKARTEGSETISVDEKVIIKTIDGVTAVVRRK